MVPVARSIFLCMSNYAKYELVCYQAITKKTANGLLLYAKEKHMQVSAVNLHTDVIPGL